MSSLFFLDDHGRSTEPDGKLNMSILRATTPRAWTSRTRVGACVPRHFIASTSNIHSTTTDASTKHGNANTEPTTSSAGDGNRDPQLSQGHVTDPAQHHPQDPLSQAARSGFETQHAGSTSKPEGAEGGGGRAKDSPPLDAASATKSRLRAPTTESSGNREGVGFVEQVGSASGTEASRSTRARNQGEGGVKEEETKPPGIFAALKQILGIGTSVEDVKQNRGGGEGVTGTGTGMGTDTGTRAEMEGTATKTGGVGSTGEWTSLRTPGSRKSYHSCATLGSVDPASSSVTRSSSATPEKESRAPSRSQYPDSSRKPKERTHGDQNEHLIYKRSSRDPDSGSGNAAEEPFLPSHRDTSEKVEGGGSDSERV
ncbi:hypothetical protein EDD16DRAFT_1562854 [Pisolithus croceorrhizus]|nr:hypothetical protein EDD16DRAFT_1562854 [Pisolithus croceorrhizus]